MTSRSPRNRWFQIPSLVDQESGTLRLFVTSSVNEGVAVIHESSVLSKLPQLADLVRSEFSTGVTQPREFWRLLLDSHLLSNDDVAGETL